MSPRGCGPFYDPCVLPRFRFARFAGCCWSVLAFAVVGESSPVRWLGGCLRFNDALAIDGVVGAPAGVGAEAGVDAEGVEPEAWADCGAAFADFGPPSDWLVLDCSLLGGGCDGPGMVPIFPKEVDGPEGTAPAPFGTSE